MGRTYSQGVGRWTFMKTVKRVRVRYEESIGEAASRRGRTENGQTRDRGRRRAPTVSHAIRDPHCRWSLVAATLWAMQEPEEERYEDEDDADVGREPLPEVVTEERQVDSDHQRRHHRDVHRTRRQPPHRLQPTGHALRRTNPATQPSGASHRVSISAWTLSARGGVA